MELGAVGEEGFEFGEDVLESEAELKFWRDGLDGFFLGHVDSGGQKVPGWQSGIEDIACG